MKASNEAYSKRRLISDHIFRFHNQLNVAVSSAVQAVMDGEEILPALHLLQTAMDLSLREMRGKITKTLEDGQ